MFEIESRYSSGAVYSQTVKDEGADSGFFRLRNPTLAASSEVTEDRPNSALQPHLIHHVVPLVHLIKRTHLSS